MTPNSSGLLKKVPSAFWGGAVFGACLMATAVLFVLPFKLDNAKTAAFQDGEAQGYARGRIDSMSNNLDPIKLKQLLKCGATHV